MPYPLISHSASDHMRSNGLKGPDAPLPMHTSQHL